MKNLPVLLAIFLLTACASLGLTPASSLDGKLAYGYATRTAVVETAAAATTSGALSVNDAKEVQVLADQARVLLDSGRQLAQAGNSGEANSKLNLAVAIIEQLQAYLHARGIK